MGRGSRVALKVVRAQVVTAVESLADDSVDSLDSETILALLEANDVKLASGWAVRCALVHSRCKSVQGSVVGLTAQYVGMRRVQVDLLMDDEGTALDQVGDRAGRHSSTLVQVSQAHALKPKHTEAQPQATHPGCHLFYLSTDRLQLLPLPVDRSLTVAPRV